MKLSERFHTLSEAPVHIRALTGVTVATLVIALIALSIACVAIGSVRRAN